MLDYNVKIGLVPMRRNTTDRPKGTFLTWYSAEQRGERFVKYIEENFTTDKVTFVDSKGLGCKDLIFDDASANDIISRFKDSDVDAVFIINCNFGNEEAAADIAKALGKPVLLWAPLDDEYYVDGDTAQVGPMLATMLNIPLITNALSVEIDNGVKTKTRLGDETAPMPALVTVERGYVLRFPSIFSKLGEVEIIGNSKIGCDIEKCGLEGSPTRVLETFENQRGKRKCKFITKEELLPLIGELKKQSGNTESSKEQTTKLKKVWAIGEEVIEKAREIAEEVILIEKSDTETIAKKAKAEKPSVILWNADLWGRKTAPQVAAMLSTGLCADCTQLEAEGDNLIMYRPAKGGNIYAKIKCLTQPQMATVRTKTESSDVIVSVGRGAIECIDEVRAFAEKIGAELGASRGMVDAGKLPYELQVGLTGKTVSPKIYVAIGISGAVHHTCAIEGADTVIAINPDKDARIFEYADYGIVGEF